MIIIIIVGIIIIIIMIIFIIIIRAGRQRVGYWLLSKAGTLQTLYCSLCAFHMLIYVHVWCWKVVLKNIVCAILTVKCNVYCTVRTELKCTEVLTCTLKFPNFCRSAERAADWRRLERSRARKRKHKTFLRWITTTGWIGGTLIGILQSVLKL